MTQDDFIDAIAANAGDEDLQLVFSDWLEEHGNTLRAELIRIQVELANLSNEDERYPALLKKEQKLWLKWVRSEMNARRVSTKPPRST